MGISRVNKNLNRIHRKRPRFVKISTGVYRLRVKERNRGIYDIHSSLFKNSNGFDYSRIQVIPNRVNVRRSNTRTTN